VASHANKMEIKSAIEYLFDVKVVSVRVSLLPRRRGRVGRVTGSKPRYKRAIIKLASMDRIDIFSLMK
jgi:large subunit ribosomal protein L23